MSSLCITLDGNTPCGPEFAGLPILTKYFPTVTTFSNAISNSIGNLDNAATGWMNRAGCVAPATRNAMNSLRYQQSIWCSTAVNDALESGCKSTSTKTMMCKSECDMAVSTLSSFLTNKAICPENVTDSAIQVRQITLATLKTYCEVNREGNSCIKGTDTETKLCGFGQAPLATQQCKSINDPCCKNLQNSPNANLTTSDNKKSNANVLNPDAVSNDAGFEGEAKSTWQTPVAVVGGIVGFLLLVGAGSWFMQKKTLDPPERKHGSSVPPSFLASLLPKQSPPPEKEPLKENIVEPVPEPKVALPSDAKRLIVQHHYQAAMSDELTLITGAEIICLKEFGDGWALGVIPTTGVKGAFPMICCKEKKVKKKPEPEPVPVQKKEEDEDDDVPLYHQKPQDRSSVSPWNQTNYGKPEFEQTIILQPPS